MEAADGTLLAPMLQKLNKTQHFCTNSEFPCHSQVHHFGGPACIAKAPAAAKSLIRDFLQLKTMISSTRNDMFWKNLASRADETPTSELGVACHKLSRQKKVSKTPAFLNVFFGRPNFM